MGGVLLALLALLAMSSAFSDRAAAVDRTQPEICDNNIDDDGDGAIDEDACRKSDTGTPVSDDGVVPETWGDNPNCAAMGFGYGFKLDGAPTGTFTLVGTNGDLTGGAPADPDNSVTVSSDGTYLTWSSTLAMDAVFVKGGPVGGNLYVYDPESTGPDSGLSTPGAASGISHVEFCYDYELEVTKTANTSFTRTYDWDIEKDFDAEYDLFVNDSQVHPYQVKVTKTGYTDSNWAVSGTITIENNTGQDAVLDTVTDEITGVGSVPVDCGVDVSGYVLADGETLECTYSSPLDNGSNRTNTATVTTSDGPDGDDGSATIDFGTATITEVDDTVTVTDTNSAFGADKTGVGATTTYIYNVTFECDADEGQHVNTAKVIGDDSGSELDVDTATVDVNCHELAVTKDAVVETYSQEYTWEIVKSPNGDYDLFTGDAVKHKYTIDVIRSDAPAEETIVVVGDITVSNVGNPIAAEITGVVDVVSGSGLSDVAATVDCTDDATFSSFPHVIAAGGTLTCSYEVTLDDPDYDLNTATATLQNYDYAANGTASKGGTTDFDGTADIVPSSTTPEILPVSFVDDKATTDTGDDYSETGITDSGSFPYERTFTCADEGTHVNTVKLYDSGDVEIGSDTATVTIECFDLVVTKDAEGSYDERHTWDVEKSVDPTSQSGYPGDELSWTWTVTLSESSVDENFALVDTIVISNVGNPIAAEITGVSDVVKDDDGIESDVIATVDCGVTFPHTIPAGGTLECTYDAGTDDLRDYETNKATATLQNYLYYGNGYSPTPDTETNGTTDYSGTADVNYTKTVLNGTAVVVDDQEPDFDPDGLTVNAGEGPWTWTETQSHTCSSSWSDYGADGTYSDTRYNTAMVTGSDGQTDSANAETTYTCEAVTVQLLKTTNGIEDPNRVWNFELYEGPDGFGSTAIATDSTPPALLDFGGPALRPDTTYTVCETGVPAGWTSFWQLNGSTVVPYNPNADDQPSEDLGNRCVDFGGTPASPVAAGTVFGFVVDNSFPGGDPRTPGYWKNWNRCTNGGQAANADKNGGSAEGYWLLEDVLDPANDGGIVWDDILSDDFEYKILSCEQAVAILDHRTTDDGRKVASDPLHNLARNLLAAQLNFGAGACTTQDVLDAALAAETLLDKYDFDGTYDRNRLPKKSPDAQLANELAGDLDDYNNGEFCGSTI